MKVINISAPGRICLFGEDVDYMGLETITLAVNKRIYLQGKINSNNLIRVELKDLDKKILFRNKKQKITENREYIKSVFNVFADELPNSFGADIKIKSSLPIGKGLSSSSAFCNVLVAFFSEVLKKNMSKEEIAKIAYKAEVENMGESGGMMDHYASAIGNLLYLECRNPYFYEILSKKIHGLVIGDTLIRKKQTIENLAQRKKEALSGIKQMKDIDKRFNLINYPFNKAKRAFNKNSSIGLKRLVGMLGIRDVVREGYRVLSKTQFEEDLFVKLVNRHHYYQRNYFENVIDEMDQLIAIAKKAGAKACKLLGTGNGGSFLAFAPNKKDRVISAIKRAKGNAYSVEEDKGINIKKTNK